jgi:hypothetical protein
MRAFLLFFLLHLGTTLPGLIAQTAAPEPLKIGDVTVSGSLRIRPESWDWFQGNANNDYTFPGSIFRLSLSQSKQKFDWQLETAVPFLLALPDDAIASGAQGQLGLGASYYAANSKNTKAAIAFAKQGFIRFKGFGGKGGQSLKLGRMEFIDGMEIAPKNPILGVLKRDRIAHRLLGNFGFSDVGRSFDGAQYTFNGSKLNLTLFGGRPTRGVFQVDGWGELKANVFYGALTGQVGGKQNTAEWRIFGLGYQDYRDGVLKTDNRPAALRTADTEHIAIGTYGGHFIDTVATSAGSLDFLFWGAVQTGSWGRQSHRAGAYAVEAGWQPKTLPRLKPWLRAGLDYGSGDKNANDTTHGTFFQVLPTPRIYARMPFFNMMNNRDGFAELLLRPAKAVTIRADVHSLALANKNDLWYSGGGVFQPQTFGYTGRTSNGHSSLATLYDISSDWNVNRFVAVGLYYGHAQGKTVIESIYPNGKNANFGFVELLFKF